MCLSVDLYLLHTVHTNRHSASKARTFLKSANVHFGTCNIVTFTVECTKKMVIPCTLISFEAKRICFLFVTFGIHHHFCQEMETVKLKAPLHLQHHLPVPTSVFPPSPSSTSWWCSRLSVKRGWVSHLSFRPLIVWHTAAQHGCQGLCRVWIRWPDYHPTRFHSPHTPALPWKQITCNLCGITCTFNNTQEKNPDPSWLI